MIDPTAQLHAEALVEAGATIGAGTRVWAFTHLLPGAVVGRDCNICDHVLIEGGVCVGSRVTVKSGVQLWAGTTLEDDVVVGPNATFTNDLFPRSKEHPTEYALTLVRTKASIGANATILAGTVVGANAMVGAGAVITRNVPPNAIVTGNPARITGYVSAHARGPIRAEHRGPSMPQSLSVRDVRLIQLSLATDARGSIAFGQHDTHLPFQPKRFFVVYDVPSKEVRGEHAHRRLEQVLTCIRGSLAVVVDDGHERDEVLLDSPEVGLYVPPMVWATQYRYSQDAMLLVLASDIYDPNDYIRSYEDFVAAVR
jgi:acetyltransferase-like isoleucine patch superfamily enzyme/dTDP-4-dehydrorhamnose 3,5-epimerase-like enzyme